MNEERAKRKLTAIFSADVAGYSRLMGDDEVGTVQLLKEYREIMNQFIQQHRGRVVDSPGDNLLAEFSSVVDATECAVKVQEKLNLLNSDLPESKRMEFRIGINLGDVIEDDARIYGDGVNIAARVEGLADGGGICVSGSVFDQIEGKMSLNYEYLGEQTVKKNRALPFKAQLFDGDIAMTDNDIPAPPVIQVIYDSGTGGDPIDVTEDALSAGQGTEGNQFVYTDEGKWQFNLKTKNYTAPGTYTVTIESGDENEYVISPTCECDFVIN